MSPAAQCIRYHILLTLNISHLKIILTKELHPSPLPSIQIPLREDVLQTVVITMQLESMPK